MTAPTPAGKGNGPPGWAHPALLAPVACYAYFLLIHRSPGYAIGGALVIAALAALFARRTDQARLPPRILLLLTALALPILGAWQFLHLKDIGDLDHGSYTCGLWNLGQGNPHYAFLGRNMFGIHSQYTSALWVPVQYLGGALGLKIGNGLCLLAAAVLLLRRLRGQNGNAAWAALALLLAPPIASQFFFGFHPELLAAPLLVFAFEAYREKRLAAFLTLTCLLAYTKETMTLPVGGLLLVALIERRNWKWILLPGLACCALMAVYWFQIVPRFTVKTNDLDFFLPASPAGILAAWARPQTLRYLAHIYVPFLPLMLAMPRRYLLLPLPTMAFYAAYPDSLFVQMWPNYAFPLVLLCLAGLWLEPGLAFSGTMETNAPKPAGRVLDGRLLPACAAAALLCYPLWREIISVPTEGPARHREAARMLDRIGSGPSMLVYGHLTSRFSARREIGILGIQKLRAADYEFALIDPGFKAPWAVDSAAVAETMRDLADTAAWTRENPGEILALFRRKTRPEAVLPP